MLGPVPLNAFINDLDARVECMLSKYVNDMKVGGALDPLEGQEVLQKYVDSWNIGQ